MAGLLQKVSGLLRSPQGQKAVEKVKELAQDPKNQKKARNLLQKFQGKQRQQP